MQPQYAIVPHPSDPSKVLWTAWVGENGQDHEKSLRLGKSINPHVVLRVAASKAHVERVIAKALASGPKRDVEEDESGEGSGDWVTGNSPMMFPKSETRIEYFSPRETLTWMQANFPKELVENEEIRDVFCQTGDVLLKPDEIESDLAYCDNIPEKIHVGKKEMKTMDWMKKMLAKVRSIASQQPRLPTLAEALAEMSKEMKQIQEKRRKV